MILDAILNFAARFLPTALVSGGILLIILSIPVSSFNGELAVSLQGIGIWLLFAGIIYICYRFLKSWILKKIHGNARFSKTDNTVDDIMIKDPFCETYFPKRNGVRLMVDGKDLYFCSEECKDKFVALHKKKNC